MRSLAIGVADLLFTYASNVMSNILFFHPFILVSLLLVSFMSEASTSDFSGSITAESFAFTESPRFSTQPDMQLSAIGELEWYQEWNAGNSSVTFKPYVRVDNQDSERNLLDIRELAWRHTQTDWELNVGIYKVFWGQTESRQRVDIINQTDSLASVDGEEKLGQPMVKLSFYRDWGALELYWLPIFRPQKFASHQGRFSTELKVTEENSYQSKKRDKAMDWAMRWSQIFGDLELGASYFYGTARFPQLNVINRNNESVYQPFYRRIQQTGVDLLYLWHDWVWKLEAIHRNFKGGSFAAVTTGFEYTQIDLFQSAIDLGWVVEYSNNSSPGISGDIAQNDIFIGNRITFNDVADSELLYGINQDLDNSSSYSIILEGSTRLSGSLRATVNLYLFNASDTLDPLFALDKDDFVQFNLEYYF